jgi:hypothetical protein
MKSKIHLVQSISNSEMYIVDRLEGRIEPQVGSLVDKKEVERLIRLTNVTVTIKRSEY